MEPVQKPLVQRREFWTGLAAVAALLIRLFVADTVQAQKYSEAATGILGFAALIFVGSTSARTEATARLTARTIDVPLKARSYEVAHLEKQTGLRLAVGDPVSLAPAPVRVVSTGRVGSGALDPIIETVLDFGLNYLLKLFQSKGQSVPAGAVQVILDLEKELGPGYRVTENKRSEIVARIDQGLRPFGVIDTI